MFLSRASISLWALFHPHSKLVWAGHAAHFLGEFGCGLANGRLMTCPMAKGRTPPLGLVAGTIRAARYVPRDHGWDIGRGEPPKGFPHTVEFGHPRPMLVPSTTRSRGSVRGEGGEFVGEQELAEETLFVFFGEGEGLGVTGLRFALRIEFGPVSLDVGSGAIPLMPLTSLPALRPSRSSTADLMS